LSGLHARPGLLHLVLEKNKVSKGQQGVPDTVLSTDPSPSYVKCTKNPFTTETQNCQTGVSPKIPDLGKPVEQSGFLWTKNAQIGSTTRFGSTS